MNVVAKFDKVSFDQFLKDMINTNNLDASDVNVLKNIKDIYDNIKLPKRATKGSAGYDFYSPFPWVLNPGESVKIPTGIRVKIENDWVLLVYTRSSLGFKYRLGLDNGTAVLDSDYYYSDNEGHIFLKMTNDTKANKIIKVESGDGIAQGIFVQYGITTDDNANGIRNGGFGSTNK